MVYRSRAEMEEWARRDPVLAFRSRLLADYGLSESDIGNVEKLVQSVLDEAVAFAAASPKPEPETALAGVYAETHGGLVF
jgi:TPP-dependent pyruvate/acetoin dehydrogenase alpha subunit